MAWQQISLEGRHVVLEPLTKDDFEPLWAIAQHESIWRYMPFAATTYEEFAGYLHSTLRQVERGDAMAFVTRLASTRAVAGSTCYLAVNEYNKRLEIGATWVTPGHQRSPVNTEAKLLQLTDAFERLGCNRVELKTDSLNERSQKAIARIGGIQEGTFRNHMVMPDGRLRHTMWFSIIREDWPEAKAVLEARLRD
ncbi:MAG: RimJ/RimL family protein N-acetyltransferase [Limisphaerales bacterium]|jgi:RimJ/RimL family protein N-acetyltransferase